MLTHMVKIKTQCTNVLRTKKNEKRKEEEKNWLESYWSTEIQQNITKIITDYNQMRPNYHQI